MFSLASIIPVWQLNIYYLQHSLNSAYHDNIELREYIVCSHMCDGDSLLCTQKRLCMLISIVFAGFYPGLSFESIGQYKIV